MTVDGLTSRPGERIDPCRDDQVVDQRDDRRERHLPLEPDRQVQDDRDQEDDQALDRLVGDLRAPGRSDRRDRQVVAIRDVHRVDQRVLDLRDLYRRQRLGLDLESWAPPLPVVARSSTWTPTASTDDAAVGDRAAVQRPLELRTALEVDRRVETANPEAHDADQHHQAGQGVPPAPAANEVPGDLTAIEPGSDRLASLACHVRPPSSVSDERAQVRRRERHLLVPCRFRSRPCRSRTPTTCPAPRATAW